MTPLRRLLLLRGSPSLRLMSADAAAAPADAERSRRRPRSAAMQWYMAKKREHDMFIARERSEFELGKKHLANMMGMEAEAMSQEDVDRAIAYLFPSGLYHPDARPKMRPPEEVFPKQKEAEFDESGRPFHPFFYCQRPNFVRSLYDVAEAIGTLAVFADRMSAGGGGGERKPSAEQLVNTPAALSTTRWVNVEELAALLDEKVTSAHRDELVDALERLLENDFSYKSKELIFRFRVPVAAMKATDDATATAIAPDEDGWVEFVGQRKTAVARVRARHPGEGRVRIRHVDHPEVECDIRYFYGLKERQMVLYPLQFAKLAGEVDIDVLLGPGGVTSQAGAIRYATAMAIRSFVDEDTVAGMKVCGLLTQDIRTTERKKPGQKGARAKYTWKKR